MSGARRVKGVALAGATAIVTGASSGIGLETARELVAREARVALAARSAEALAEARAELEAAGGEALVVPTDVTDAAAVRELVARTRERFGRVDVFVANAGVSQRSLFEDTEVEVLRRIMEVNFFGSVHGAKAVLPVMKEQGSGHLVFVSSIAGRVGTPLRSGYCASKFATQGFADSIRIELAAHGIGVTVVSPGFTRTGVARNALTGDGSPQGHDDKAIAGGASPRGVARALADAVERGTRDVHLTAQGKTAVALGRLAPGLLDRVLARVPVR